MPQGGVGEPPYFHFHPINLVFDSFLFACVRVCVNTYMCTWQESFTFVWPHIMTSLFLNLAFIDFDKDPKGPGQRPELGC